METLLSVIQRAWSQLEIDINMIVDGLGELEVCHLPSRSLTHSLTFTQSHTYLLTHSLNHLYAYLLTHLLTYLLAHLLTHLLTKLLTQASDYHRDNSMKQLLQNFIKAGHAYTSLDPTDLYTSTLRPVLSIDHWSS